MNNNLSIINWTVVLENIKELARNHRLELWGLLIFSAITNILMLAPSLYMLQVFDRVMTSRNEMTLLVLTLIVIFLHVVQAYAEITRSRLMMAIVFRLETVATHRVFRGIFKSRMLNRTTAPTQSLSDLNSIRQWLTGQSVFVFFDLPWAPIYVAVMFMLHPILGWTTIFFMFILGCFTWWNFLATKESKGDAEDEELELNKFIYSRVRNAEIIEAHGMVPVLLKDWWTRQQQTFVAQADSEQIRERFTLAGKQLRLFMQSLALGIGAWLAIRGEISFGGMFAASLLMGRATAPIDQILAGWQVFVNINHAGVRLVEVINTDQANENSFNLPIDKDVKIKLSSVSAYTFDRKKSILDCINLELIPNKIYLLTGDSGAGKSTLGKLILGIWPTIVGDVKINNIGINDISSEWLSAHVGYLPQEVQLFNGTVAENIARMQTPSPELVIQASKLAGIHELILLLPDGYDTHIGEAGGNLSGGQRQRVGLARAIYGSPKIIVLDEPNSNLDQAGESQLCEALIKIKELGSIIVVIGHRGKVMDIADETINVHDGQI